jgi:hypothetical protein
MPESARLSLSVPPEVKTISLAAQFRSRATEARACSTAERVRWPEWCAELGLPKASRKKGRIASKTSGRTGVVALASR